MEELAGLAGASRSVLADRFKSILGQPPMQYIASWRLQLATSMLRNGDRALAEIAADVGYESEAAFSRAFGTGGFSSSSRMRAKSRADIRVVSACSMTLLASRSDASTTNWATSIR